MSGLEELTKALETAIGTNDEKQEVKEWFNTGYEPLNLILSGDQDKGLPFGRIIEIFGPSSSGKTILATQMMIAAQKKGGVAMFMDHEGTFQVNLAKENGLSDEFPFWIYKRPNTWEESNTLALKAVEVIRKSGKVADTAPIVVVFDSIAAMIPKSVFERGIDEYSMNDTTALARVASSTIKAVNQKLGQLNGTFLYLNQIRTKPGVVYGDPTTTPGGSAMEFYASVRLSLSFKRVMEETDGTKEMIGQLITIKTKKNKLTRPFQEVDLMMRFNEEGVAYFDFVASYIEMLVTQKKLSFKPRLVWKDGKSYFKRAFIEMIASTGGIKELKEAFPVS